MHLGMSMGNAALEIQSNFDAVMEEGVDMLPFFLNMHLLLPIRRWSWELVPPEPLV